MLFFYQHILIRTSPILTPIFLYKFVLHYCRAYFLALDLLFVTNSGQEGWGRVPMPLSGFELWCVVSHLVPFTHYMKHRKIRQFKLMNIIIKLTNMH
jgi:hypothetical protein